MEDKEVTQMVLVIKTKYARALAELRRLGNTVPIRSFTISHTDIINNQTAEVVVSHKNLADITVKDAFKSIGVEEKVLKNLEVRYINLPSSTSIRDLKSVFVGQTRSFEGIVRRVSAVKSKATIAVFQCQNCTARVTIPQKDDTNYPDSKCSNCGYVAKWKVLSDQGEYVDYQTILVQEFPETVSSGDQPKSITIALTSDLVGTVIPGNRVTICGVLKLRKVKSETGLIFEPYVDGNSIVLKDETYDSVEITDEDIESLKLLSKTPKILDTLSASIAPTVYGNEDVKKGIMLQLFGGVVKNVAGTRMRPDIHILLIGDPGIAKSVIMRHALSLIPRGIFTHGNSASAAGLTAAAVKDEDGQWVLEAGALVLASGGGCGVDEMDKMNKNDREALHGAMEQQEIDIAKAGIVAKLYTRCFLLAAANPKLGRFDMHASLSQQFEIPSTLISRFDLIYALSDTPEAQKDSAIADYILNTHMTQEVKTGLPNEVLRKYIAYARTINPKLTKEAVLVIKEYYTKVRGLANNMEAVPITARSLEALVRLCEAAARSRLSETITVDDAGVVVTLVDTCMRKIAYDAASNTWDVDKIINKYPKRSRDIVARINDAIIVLGGVEGIASQNDVAAHLKRMYGTNEEDTLNHIEMLYNERRVMYPRNGYVRLVK